MEMDRISPGCKDMTTILMFAMETFDADTAIHCRCVAKMTERIGQLLFLEDEQMVDIYIGALLHDIGKLKIKQEILLKTGSLDDREMKQIKNHAMQGYEILRQIKGFEHIAQIVRHHHERWDGSGYPDKIVGEDIPIGARIIAIADSIDAMLSDRCYRKALPNWVCYQEIKTNSSNMYDPFITSAVLLQWDEVLEARKLGLYTHLPKEYGQAVLWG